MALSQTKSLPTLRPQYPPLSHQGQLVADLQKHLQHKAVITTDVVFGQPVFAKGKAQWHQDSTVKLSGPYTAVRDLLLDIPRALNSVALTSVKLTRATNVVGQIECEAVFRAYYTDDRSQRAGPL